MKNNKIGEVESVKVIKINLFSYVMDAVSKLTIEGIKLSLFRMERMVFQSETSGYSLVSSSRHIDSNASLTIAGGLAIERTSDNCFFLMPLTAVTERTILNKYRF